MLILPTASAGCALTCRHSLHCKHIMSIWQVFKTRATDRRYTAQGLALSTLLALVAISPPALAVDVGVSVQISQPGVYGRVDIGRFPQPQVVVEQPITIRRVVSTPDPVYMWVPPGHRKNWSKHCGAYNACGVPVYFVRDSWYDAKVGKEKKNKGHDKGYGNDKGHGNGNDKGNGNGKGNGHNKHDR